MATLLSPAASSIPAARHRLILVLFCAAIWLPGLPARTLWPTDEPRYSLVAREMIARGDLVVPIRNGEVYHSQPPLFLWCEAAMAALAGDSEAALRVPSFLAGLGGVLIVHALASAWFGPGAGLLSGLVLATDIRYLLQAQWISTDMLLCLLVTGSLACFARGYGTGRRGWYLVCYVLASAATMTKGPVGFVLPGLVIVSFLALRRDLGEILRMRLFSGTLIFMVIVLPWYLMFWHRAGGESALDLVLTQSFRRYVSAWNNQQPWYYFLWRLPADLLPWTPVLPFAVWVSLRRMPDRDRLLLYCWIAAMFVFFSISTGKRGVYLLPAHPAAAILIGWLWDAAIRAPEDRSMARCLRWCSLLTAFVFVVAGISTLASRSALAAIEGAGPAASVLGGLGLAAGTVLALTPPRRSPHAAALATGLLAVVALVIAAPVENRRRNQSDFTAELTRQVPEGARLGIVRKGFEEISFYSGRTAEIELETGRSLRDWMKEPETVYAVLDRRSYEQVLSKSFPPWDLLARGEMAGREYFLIVKR